MKIIVNGLAVEYQDEGIGPTALFLHGWKDDLHTFDVLVPLLSDRLRIIRLDLPGFGKTEMVKGTWNLDDYVAFVADFIKKLNLQVSVLVGHSFGGRVIIKGQALGKLEVDKIILIAPAGVSIDRKIQKGLLLVLAKFGKYLTYLPPFFFWRQRIIKKMYGLVGSDYPSSGLLKGTFLKIISEDLSPFAKSIKTPTLLIWGSEDRQTPLADGQRMAKLITGSQFNTLNGATHFVHQERSREVADLIKQFI